MSEPTACPRCGAVFPDEDSELRHMLREHTLSGACQQLSEAMHDLLREAGLFRFVGWLAGWLDRQLRRMGVS